MASVRTATHRLTGSRLQRASQCRVTELVVAAAVRAIVAAPAVGPDALGIGCAVRRRNALQDLRECPLQPSKALASKSAKHLRIERCSIVFAAPERTAQFVRAQLPVKP